MKMALNYKGVQVELLDGNDIARSIYKRTKTKEILDNIFSMLNIIERDYFGLYFIKIQTDERIWLNVNESVWSQIVKVIEPPYQLYFGVKYFPYDPLLLQEDITLYMMYLQLRREIKDGRVICPDNERVEMLAHILQAEGGDHGDKFIHKHRNFFVNLQRITPKIENDIIERYKQLTGLDVPNCEMTVMEKALQVTYYDQEVYHVRSDAQPGLRKLTFTLGPIGIGLYQNTTKLDIFGWMEIWNVGYINHTFWFRIVRDGEKSKHKFHFDSSKTCEHVWKAFRKFFKFYIKERKIDEKLLFGRIPPKFERVSLFTEQTHSPLKQILGPKISRENISGLIADPAGNNGNYGNRLFREHYGITENISPEKRLSTFVPDNMLSGSGRIIPEKQYKQHHLQSMFSDDPDADSNSTAEPIYVVSGHSQGQVESLLTAV